MLDIRNQKYAVMQATVAYMQTNKNHGLYDLFSNKEIGKIGGFRIDRLPEEIVQTLCTNAGRTQIDLPEITIITTPGGIITDPHVHQYGASLARILTANDHPAVIDVGAGAYYISGQFIRDNTTGKQTAVLTRHPLTPNYTSTIYPEIPHCFENAQGNEEFIALTVTYPPINGAQDFTIIPRNQCILDNKRFPQS